MAKSSTASLRKRRYRQRQRADVVVAPVEVSLMLTSVLIDTGWLLPEESEDRHQIGKALTVMLSDFARDPFSKK